jgi:outer membrane protein assembly factor BamB
LRAAEAKRTKYIALLSREELATKFEAVQALMREKRYTEADRVLQDIKKSPHAGAELSLKVEKELQAIAKAKGEALALVNAARAREAADDLDGALTLYDECRSRLGNTPSGPIAAKRHRELIIDRDRAQTLYKGALRHYAKGEFTDAHGDLKKAARIKGFKVARLARQRLDEMKTAHTRAAELLARAESLRNEGELDESFKALVELLERFPYTSAARGLTLEVSIETFPVGATVVKNGRDLGPAPIPAARFLPTESGVLVISKRGFATHEHKYDKVRTRVLRFYLKKKAAFRKGLGQPVRASPVAMEASGAGAKGAFFVHAGPTLAAFSSDRGELLWQLRAGPAPSVRLHPSVLDKTVLVASGKALRAFSATGELSYEVALTSPVVTSPAAVKLKLLANRAFAIVCCRDGSVVSIDLVAREARWTARVAPPIRFDPAVSERAVFVPSSDATIAAFDTRSGRRLWVANVAGEVACDLALDPEAKLVGALSSVGEVLALGASNGMVRTRAALDGVRGGGIAIADRVVYVGGDDGKLRAIDVGTGTTAWTLPVGGAVRGTPTIRGGEIYVGTEKGNLICVDRRAGREEWRFPADSAVTAGATIVGGMLVFGTEDGEVFGLEVGKK